MPHLESQLNSTPSEFYSAARNKGNYVQRRIAILRKLTMGFQELELLNSIKRVAHIIKVHSPFPSVYQTYNTDRRTVQHIHSVFIRPQTDRGNSFQSYAQVPSKKEPETSKQRQVGKQVVQYPSQTGLTGNLKLGGPKGESLQCLGVRV